MLNIILFPNNAQTQKISSSGFEHLWDIILNIYKIKKKNMYVCRILE